MAHAFNTSTREAEAGGFLSSRPAWSAHKKIETLYLKQKKKKKKKKVNLKKNKINERFC